VTSVLGATMTKTILLASLLVVTGCTTSVHPISGADPIVGKQTSPPAAAASGDLGQGHTEVPHGNTKMDGPPGN
jgi:hypothetical protein